MMVMQTSQYTPPDPDVQPRWSTVENPLMLIEAIGSETLRKMQSSKAAKLNVSFGPGRPELN